jgi:DNA-binding SARP family transcriptional activator
VLGRVGVVRAGELFPGPPGVPGRALRILAVRGRLHVEELSEMLWPGADAQSGRPRLRNVVSRIRSAVGPVVERTEDLLGLASDVEVDTERFEQLAKQALAAAAEDPLAATEPASAAVELYQGPLLPDCPYDEWAVAPRERARRRYVGLLDLLAEAAALRGETDAALVLLERAAETEPYDDERLLRAAELCLDAGRRGAAASLLERAGSVNGRLGVPAAERFQQLSARLRG